MTRILLAVILLLGSALGWSLWSRSLSDARADRAEAAVEQMAGLLERTTAIVEVERARAAELAAIGERYEQEKQDAQVAADKLVADLRADNRRLRAHWQAALGTSELSRAAAAAAFPDGGAELRQRDIGAAHGVVGRCQAQVRGLQAVVRADRAEVNL